MRAGRLELGGEGSDLTLELAGLELVPGAGEPPFLGGGEDPSVDGPMVRRLGWVVAFDHFGTDSLAAGQLLLGAKRVREPVVQIPDLVEHLHFGVVVETEAADEGADVGPVLLLDVGAVVLVSRARPGEHDLVRLAMVQPVAASAMVSVKQNSA